MKTLDINITTLLDNKLYNVQNTFLSLESQRLKVLYISKEFHFLIFPFNFPYRLPCTTQQAFAFILGLLRISIYLSTSSS